MMAWLRLNGKMLACVVGIFIAGVFAGGLVTAGVIRHLIAKRLNPANWNALILQKMDRRLHLTPEQEAKVAPLVQQAVSELRATRSEALTRSAMTISQLKSSLAPILTPDQQREFDHLLLERQQRRQALGGSAPQTLPKGMIPFGNPDFWPD